MDYLKEELNNYREVFKFLLLLTLATLSASFGLLYKFMDNQTSSIVAISFSFAGFIGIAFILVLLKIVWKKMNDIIKEMKNG